MTGLLRVLVLSTGMMGCLLDIPPLKAQLLAQTHRKISNNGSPSQPGTLMLREALMQLKKQYSVDILFEEKLLEGISVSSGQIQADQSIELNLSKLLQPVGLRFKKVRKDAYVILNARTDLKTSIQEPSPSIQSTVTIQPTASVLQPLPTTYSGSAQAVDQTVNGRVTDENNAGLPGVNVVVKGTNRGTTTDVDGRYRLNVPETGNILLIFSLVGYVSQEVGVGTRSAIDIQLIPDNKTLNEVVVTGYLAQQKKDLVGAVTVVDVDKLTRQPTGQVTNMLQGQASGVSVLGSGQPGQEPTVIIRGQNTFGNNNPLYVVDGVPVTNIGNLNPNDVASMQVLKDAGAASIYGSRAANGVIIITTKRGNGKPRIAYDAYYGTQVPKKGNVWNKLDPAEMAELRFQAIRNTATINGVAPAYNNPLYGPGPNPRLPDYIIAGNVLGALEGDQAANPARYYVNPNYTTTADYASFYRIIRANKEGTDWYNAITRNAPIQSHNLSVGAGNDQGNYLFSLNYFNQQGTVIYTGFERYSIRANSTYNLSKNVRIGENISYTITNDRAIGVNSLGGPVANAMNMEPIIPVYDIMGNYASTFGLTGNFSPSNPLATLERTRNNKNVTNRLFGNVFAEATLFNLVTLRTSFGGEYNSSAQRAFTYPTWENTINSAINRYAETYGGLNNYTWTNTATFKKETSSGHNITVLLGTENYSAQTQTATASAEGYYSFDPDYTTLTTGTTNRLNTSARSLEKLFSLIGRVDYQFKDKYLLSATLRRDGSSKFLNNQYGWFPAASVGWRLSEEKFLKGLTWLQDLKIRGGYGVMGNQLNVNPSNSFSLYTSDPASNAYDFTGSNSVLVTGFSRAQLGNPDAKWEKNIQSNIGFDAALWNGKVSITADWYNKDVKDLLFNAPIAGTAGGATVPYVNIASMKNSGFDLSITSRTRFSSDFTFDATLNFTTYKNQITKVSNTSSYFDDPNQRRNFPASIVRNQVGQPFNSFFGYRLDGFWDSAEEIQTANQLAKTNTNNPVAVYQTDMAVGRFRYADVNGDGIITDQDRTFLGNPIPKFSYGLNLVATYKAFDLSLFFYGTQGNDIWNNTKYSLDFNGSVTGAKSKTALYDSWTPTHQDAKAPILENAASFSSYGTPNSYFVEKGSYLRLKNMQIGYSLPKTLLSKVGLNNLRLYVQGANLLTVTNYKGLDPEIGSSVTTSPAVGIDEGTYPNQKQYIVGLNLKF